MLIALAMMLFEMYLKVQTWLVKKDDKILIPALNLNGGFYCIKKERTCI